MTGSGPKKLDGKPEATSEIKPANQRGAARLAAVQALYQMDVGGTGLIEIIAEFEDHRLGAELDGEQYRQSDPAWFRAIMAGVVERQLDLDPMIRGALTEDWPLSRLDATLRAILRAGAWELERKRDVPVAVIVNEYVDVARAFYADEEPKIVNAVLDRLARKLRGQPNQPTPEQASPEQASPEQATPEQTDNEQNDSEFGSPEK